MEEARLVTEAEIRTKLEESLAELEKLIQATTRQQLHNLEKQYIGFIDCVCMKFHPYHTTRPHNIPI